MSRAFVEAITDLAENVATLQFACTRGDRYAQQILKNGTNYVAVNLDGKKAFAPSRFVGYLSNSPAEHRAATEKSGTDTDRIINRLLGESPIHSITLDRGFIAFCAEFDIVPSAKARVFWNLPGDFEGVDSVDLDERRDIDEILNRHSGKKTNCKRLMDARLGQGAYRKQLLDRFGGRCAASGCALKEILRASHCKPWRLCSDEERLDPENGLLLEARLDALFDRFLISFNRKGEIVISAQVERIVSEQLGLPGTKLIKPPNGSQWRYLAEHCGMVR